MNFPLSYSAIFLSSLVGSLHCIGMCGGIVSVYCLGCAKSPGTLPEKRFRNELIEHTSYNLGRLLSYLTLGALAGVIGGELDSAATSYTHGLAALFFGIIIILWGGLSLLQAMGVRILVFPGLQNLIQRPALKIFSRIQKLPKGIIPLTIGVLTGALPCGWLYLFVAAAASTSSAPGGAAVMLFFWLGTLPAMLSVGFGIKRLTQPLTRSLPLVSSLLMLMIGVLTVTGKFIPAFSLVDHSHHHSNEHHSGDQHSDQHSGHHH